MDFAKRIIPCLDIKEGRVVKGVNFVGLKDAGDPVEIAKEYNRQGADEIVFLDITASVEKRSTTLDMVKKVAKEIFIPFTVGGGISSMKDMSVLLNAGCDKISVNSSAVKNPSLIDEGAKHFGSQCIVVAIDARRNEKGSWNVYVNGGRIDSHKDAIQWAKEVCDRGAGEILLTSMDTDGTKAGYDIAMIQAINAQISIPIIASGGAGDMQHFCDVFVAGADAALAASIFHFKEIDILDLKSYLAQEHIPVRI